jgi:heterodisulfide reductase subunit C
MCTNCWPHENLETPEMDLNCGEIMRAVARNDPRVLENRSLWVCDELLEKSPRCQAGLDIASVILALRREAQEREGRQV